MTIKVEGLEQATKAIKAKGTAYRQAVAKAVFSEAQALLTESKILVPVITGNLKSSGRVNMKEGGDIEAVISYGDPTVPYALRVHEEPRPPTSNGTYKYLETPFKEASGKYAARIAANAKKYMRGPE